MAKEESKFDIRTIERFVRDGIVSRDEYEEHLESLPDVSDKAVKMESEFVEGVLEDDDEEEALSEEEEENDEA